MEKKTKKVLKATSEEYLKHLVEENDEVRIVREITRLSKSTIKIPVPFTIDKTNQYKI
ncbi:MAG: hypothetical protein HY758_03385 [Nitrospirae bacterium]|nr:hypothetical protein [Nitrospirota bacterium]